jgi:4-diphosphocytidyl-2-C-methyl-D-erythritol kinase
MSRLTVRSPAKVNLTFDILRILPDGYHEVETLLQSIDLADTLNFTFEQADQFTVSLSCQPNDKDFPLDNSNLVAKAAHLFFMHADNALPKINVRVHIDKQIPIAAGLAGGSSNAAATLLACNTYCHDRLATKELLALCEQLGADVPFCLVGGTQIGTRRGDRLLPARLLQPLSLVIVKPQEISIATPWVYAAYDRHQENEPASAGQKPSTKSAVEAFARGDFAHALSCLGNAFEPVVFEHYKGLPLLQERLLDLGCQACHLTGSGPTFYGITKDPEAAHYIREQLILDQSEGRSKWSDHLKLTLDCHVAQSINHGVFLAQTPVK